MKKLILIALAGFVLGGCSLRILNFDENSVIKREYDILSYEKGEE